MIARAAAAGLALSVAVGCGAVDPSPLVNGHDSVHRLADAVVRGFERRDVDALATLAVTEAEFRDRIWPELPASRPERNLPFSYVWGDLRQKSENSLASLLARYGGRSMRLVRVDHAGESTRYRSFTVHRETVLTIRVSDGGEHRVRLFGSTLERQRIFKVFSYVVDE